MGQKTHPVGFRLQVSKDWKSTWFTENSFASELESDVKIRKYLKARLPNAGISKVDISRTSKSITITIFTARPGIVIGKGGEEVNRLKDEVKQLTNTQSNNDGDTKNIQINISEIKRPELDAALVGANIAHQLQKKISYRRVVSKVIQSTMRMGADGIRINVAGRLGGAEIARSEKFSEGRVPLHTLRADIDYVLTEAYTQYGIIGIKVWICNGESGK
ncbi:MAG: 30S ribosomal protein S3 [Candidatus Marinimicrobia bacterium]|mgnify:FL=1|nr:30S ribosomal protein S3 [Candidatus Neomarinimicrobiota bacterium]MBP00293.1 30S ribosomal protein S3 [Candidatus Neomarinimicrobiota bacterium]